MEAFQWRNRLILVFAEPNQVESIATALEDAKTAIEERHVLWFVVTGETLRSNYSGDLEPSFRSELVERHRKGATAPVEVVMIGKDGGVKYRADKLELNEIFARIDSMPMRRSEMRKNSPSRKEK